MQFETKLHFMFKKQRDIKTISLPKIKGIDYHNIKSIIDELHFEYEQRGTSLENDLNSTLDAVSLLSNLIVQHCIETYQIPAFAV